MVYLDFFSMGPGYQLTIKDSLSGFCKLQWFENCTALEAAKGLLDWIAMFDVPKWIVTDGGPHFRTKVFQELKKVLGHGHHIGTPYHHESLGSVEVLQRACKALYRKLCMELKWPIEHAKDLMPAVMLSLNQQKTTRGFAPCQVMLGREPSTPLKLVVTQQGLKVRNHNTQEITQAMQQQVAGLVKEARAALDKYGQKAVQAVSNARTKQGRRRNRDKRGNPLMRRHFEEGTFVLVAVNPSERRHKFEPIWSGPWVVVRPIVEGHGATRSSRGDDAVEEATQVYEVSLMGQPSTTRLAHVNRMKLFSAKQVDMPARMQAELVDSAQRDYQQFVVERFDNFRVHEGQLQLWTKWLGFSEQENNWESASTMATAVPSLVHKFCSERNKEHPMIDELLKEVLSYKGQRMRSRNDRAQAKLQARLKTKAAEGFKAPPPKKVTKSQSARGAGRDWASDQTTTRADREARRLRVAAEKAAKAKKPGASRRSSRGGKRAKKPRRKNKNRRQVSAIGHQVNLSREGLVVRHKKDMLRRYESAKQRHLRQAEFCAKEAEECRQAVKYLGGGFWNDTERLRRQRHGAKVYGDRPSQPGAAKKSWWREKHPQGGCARLPTDKTPELGAWRGWDHARAGSGRRF